MLERLKCDALGSADASRKLMRFDDSNDSLLDHSYLASKELWTDNDASRVYWTASNNKKAIFFLARLENLIITWKLMMKRVALGSRRNKNHNTNNGWMDVNKSLLFLVPSTFRRTEDYDSYRRSFMRWNIHGGGQWLDQKVEDCARWHFNGSVVYFSKRVLRMLSTDKHRSRGEDVKPSAKPSGDQLAAVPWTSHRDATVVCRFAIGKATRWKHRTAKEPWDTIAGC